MDQQWHKKSPNLKRIHLVGDGRVGTDGDGGELGVRLGHDVRGEVGGLAEELDHALHGLDDQEEEEHGEGHTEDRPLDYAVEEDLAKINVWRG